uniref:Bifunctional inhibitor/plant lipid transfer protein/seed storage helical domain-containing protein n=1 Tax=Kalanchoe fedtschenkoi TaxID=63787 RepID=A0A7N1A4N5_KALFE
MKNAKATSVAIVGLLLVLANSALVAESVKCNPVELISCLPAFVSPKPPSLHCCSKLKEKLPCYCTYIKDPALAKYINNPEGEKVMKVCRLPSPKCPVTL